MTTSPQIGYTRLEEGQNQAEVSVNTALNLFDAVVQLSVKDRDLNTPPGSPSEGDRYLIPDSPTATGDWLGQEGKLAAYYNGWTFLTPKEGWQVWIDDEDIELIYNGSTYEQIGGGRWTFISTQNYTATPASTSRITMSNTSNLEIGLPLRITYGGTTRFAIVSDLIKNRRIDIVGAPLNTGSDIQKLEVGTSESILQEYIQIDGTYGDDVSDILATDQNTYRRWSGSDAALVAIAAIHKVADTGAAQPKVNVKINDELVSTDDSNNGIQLGSAGVWVENSAVAINESNYLLDRNSDIEIRCTAAGSNSDASDLTLSLTYIFSEPFQLPPPVNGFMGGGASSNVIDIVDISGGNVNGSDYGDLTVSRGCSGGVAAKKWGYFCGGGTNSDVIESIDLHASTGNASDTGNLTVGRAYAAGIQSEINAFICGGQTSDTVDSNVIDYFDMEIPVSNNATDRGDLVVSRSGVATGWGSTNGYMMGGAQRHTDGGSGTWTLTDHIEYIDHTTTSGNASDVGDLFVARWSAMGITGTNEVFCGGGRDGTSAAPSTDTTLDYIDKTTTSSNASDRGDTFDTKSGAGACSGTTNGFLGGGEKASGTTNTLGKFDLTTTTGNGSSSGTISTSRGPVAGVAYIP